MSKVGIRLPHRGSACHLCDAIMLAMGEVIARDDAADAGGAMLRRKANPQPYFDRCAQRMRRRDGCARPPSAPCCGG